MKLAKDEGFNFVFNIKVLANMELWRIEKSESEMIIENKGDTIQKINEDETTYTFKISDKDCYIVFILPKLMLVK